MLDIGLVRALIKKFAPGVSPESIAQAVDDYLDAHPEATTTVQDGSITEVKLATALAAKVGEIDTLSEAIEKQKPPVEYKFSGTDLLLGFGFSSTLDYVIVMNNGRANGLFDFAKLCTKAKGTSLEDLDTADLTTVWSSSTDMHSPFQFLAVNNADGYHADAQSASFTGGNHTLDSLGTGFETAESVYVNFYADGIPVSSGNGICSAFEIRWANDVQAYNTVKQGGGGRACLREYHDMVFDGVSFKEKITLKALEAIKMSWYDGLQCISIGTTYDNIAFVDGSNRGTFDSSDSDIESGNATASGLIAWGDTHRIEMFVDTGVDLGKRTFYSGTKGAYVSSYGKGYFSIIGQTMNVNAGEMFYLDGGYRFVQRIAETEPEPPTETLTLNKDSITVDKVGDTDTLVATHTPASASDVFTWTSSDTNVATVNSSGVVTVHGIGTATITVTCGQLSATATVTQTTIKAPYELKTVVDKVPAQHSITGEDFTLLRVSSTSGQNSIGQAYHDNDKLRVENGQTNDIECVEVPYGATKVKIKTSDDVAVSISYWYTVDASDIVTYSNVNYPKFKNGGTFFNTSNGAAVEYGEAVMFRPTSAQSATLSYIYFE